jgi:uncharacterized protein DUF3108
MTVGWSRDEGGGQMRDSAPIDGRCRRISCVLLSVVLVLSACRDHKGSSSGNTTLASGDTAVRTIAMGPSAAHAASPPPRSASPAKVATAASAATKSTTPGQPTVARSDSIVTASTSTAPVTATTPTAAPAAAAAPPAPSRLALALARLPFGENERLEYQVKYGFLGVGSATLEVQGLDSVRGMPAIHATFKVAGGVRFYRVNDDYESWFDPESYSTLRAVQSIDEGSYDRQRTFEFFPDRKVFIENGKPEAPTVPDPLDEASFLFFLRSIPLEVGQTYQFERYFRLDKNPVRVEVVRREPVKVPAGTFNAIVVRPVIKTTGIFGEGGRAEIWFTDDSTRTLVQLKSSLKFGSLNLYLRSRRPGTPWEGAAPR